MIAGRDEPEDEPEVDRQPAERRERRRRSRSGAAATPRAGTASVCWKPPSLHGPKTQNWTQDRAM